MQLFNPIIIITNKKNIILTIIVVLLVFGNVFLGIKYFFQVQETEQLQKQLTTQQTNVKVANFLNLFVKKVLKTDKEVPFEDRLKLENSIRDINDPEVLAKWEQFTKGTNEAQIQQGVKDLLEVLVSKISY